LPASSAAWWRASLHERSATGGLQDPLARQILEGRIHDGDRVTVDAGESGLLINGTAVPLAA
jgi:hypothetical protein